MRDASPHVLRRAARAAALAAVVSLCAASTAAAGTQYWITGRGWGHGIGMSQYGAQGFAKRGFTARQIIQYYYQKSTVEQAQGAARTVRVLLSSGRTTTRLRVDAPGASVSPGGSLAAGDTLTITQASGVLSVRRTRAGVTTTLASGVTGPVRVTGPASSVAALFTAESGAFGRHYRGELSLHAASGGTEVVNVVGIDDYVRGVVPGEMPTSWAPAALGAQSIAARSYALATRRTSGNWSLHSDTRSQMYLGIEHEKATSNAAVAATSGLVATYGGQIITTFFSSTSGGRTAAIQDVWSGSTAKPYYASVPDPYEQSPYSAWPERLSFTPAQLALKLGIGSVRGVTLKTNGSQRASALVITGAGGGTTLVGATTVQWKLGLRSTWFRVRKVSISPSVPSVRPEARVRLAGQAPSGAALWRRPAGGPWIRVAAVSSGSWSRGVRPSVTTTYRLRVGSRSGPSTRVTVR